MNKLSQSTVSQALSTRTLVSACALSIAIAVSGCSNNNTAATSLTGSVSAPGGSLAFHQPTGIKNMFASIFAGKQAHAALSGVSAVGAGVTMELIEVDAAGVKVGAALATATTDASGAYTMIQPNGFTASSKYVIRATAGGINLDVRVTGTANDVDPISNVTSALVTSQAGSAADLGKITIEALQEIADAVIEIANNTDLTGKTTVADFATAITTDVNSNEELSNQLTSSIAGGQICGTVKDANAAVLSNIRIVVRDYGNWVTRAKTKTKADGTYCVRVPDGGKKYILGALNFTGTSTAASEWWAASGTAYSQINGEAITVTDTTVVTKDFNLEAGARITGSVLAGTGGLLTENAPLENVRIIVRDYTSNLPVTGARVKADGTFRVNVHPNGTDGYLLVARNKTRVKNYATGIYDGAAAGNTAATATAGKSLRGFGSRVTLTAGATKNIHFKLAKGYRLKGTVLDKPLGSGGVAVTGTIVFINGGGVSSKAFAGPAVRLRTNKLGKYGVWLKPEQYSMTVRGQAATPDLRTADVTQGFSAATGTVTATINNSDGAGNPTSQIKVSLTDVTTGAKIHTAVTSSDGVAVMYAPTAANYRILATVDDVRTGNSAKFGSVMHGGGTMLLAGTQSALAVPGDNNVGNINLLSGGILTGTVYLADGTTPAQNVKVQIRSGGTGGANKFITRRTRGDGTYTLSLPAKTYDAVRAFNANEANGINATGVIVGAGAVKTQDITLPAII